VLEHSKVPSTRIRLPHERPLPVQAEGDFVLYWMISARRSQWNFGLQRAVEWALELNKPLVVLEALRAGYQWNSDRFHAFVIQGMADNARSFANTPVTYYPYLEPNIGDENGLIKALARDACLIVSDDFPCFFLPRMVKAAARTISVWFELIDSNGLYPMRHTDRIFTRAFDFRRHLQKELLPHLQQMPEQDPLEGKALKRLRSLPKEILQRWPAADPLAITRDPATLQQALQEFPINHAVGMVDTMGGSVAANQRANQFIGQKLKFYGEQRNEPEKDMSSGLSPYLHFGHLSVHQIFSQTAQRSKWSADKVAAKPTGQSTGWWGALPEVESFWDELITWRELGYNMCANSENYDQYESLPNWAQLTLREHESDPRLHLYTLEQFEQSQTHDPLWNATQNQLVTTGGIHNYLRMLWGKKILEWSPNARSALATMIELNNKWALDGRNPNSYSGIFWVLGRYDRAWNEREVFGKIRYMTSENTARKYRVKDYIRRYSRQQPSLF
jgi:deoxyribodipyrimidine photo-lyase